MTTEQQTNLKFLVRLEKSPSQALCMLQLTPSEALCTAHFVLFNSFFLAQKIQRRK